MITPEKLKQIRADMDMSLSQLSTVVKKPKSTLAAMEQGRRPIPVDMVTTLKAALYGRLDEMKKKLNKLI